MLGTIVNTIAVIIGSGIGLLLKKGIPERLSDTMMKGIGLCTLFLGIKGSLDGQNSLIMIISIVIGACQRTAAFVGLYSMDETRLLAI